MSKSIFKDFPISTPEYLDMEKAFGRLCHHAAHDLQRKNYKNNYTDEYEDITQNLFISLIEAGSYYKRQVYIDKCFTAAEEYAKDNFCKEVLASLQQLWKDRTRHGANRRKFGTYQEKLLEILVRKIVPLAKRPNKKAPLVIDDKFPAYCKQIIWNKEKAMGKKITREKTIRSGQVSLSNFNYLGADTE